MGRLNGELPVLVLVWLGMAAGWSSCSWVLLVLVGPGLPRSVILPSTLCSPSPPLWVLAGNDGEAELALAALTGGGSGLLV